MTYSIVARDSESGELGVAVRSHWFSVGPTVPWAAPGVCAVATQANVEVAYGPRALADHPDPLGELHRLVELHRAYGLAGRADELTNEGRHDEAAALYRKASDLAPGNDELQFWAGLGAAQAGGLDTAVGEVRAAIAGHPGWRELLERLSPQTAPSAAGVRARLEDGRD